MTLRSTILTIATIALGSAQALASPTRPIQPQAPTPLTQSVANEYGGYDIAGANIGGENFYATTRGWTVNSAGDNGLFAYCVGAINQNGSQIRLGYDGLQWQLAVPINTGPTWQGTLEVDGDRRHASGTAVPGWAIAWLTLGELDRLKRGNHAVLDVSGYSYDFALNGSTAVTLKITECVQRAGQIPQPQAAAPAPQPQLQAPVPATCETVTEGVYGCSISPLPPEPGYNEIIRVDPPNLNFTTYIIKMRASNQADVWAAFSDGIWRNVGVWIETHQGSDCIQPAPIQTAQARAGLGQDAWMLCIR